MKSLIVILFLLAVLMPVSQAEVDDELAYVPAYVPLSSHYQPHSRQVDEVYPIYQMQVPPTPLIQKVLFPQLIVQQQLSESESQERDAYEQMMMAIEQQEQSLGRQMTPAEKLELGTNIREHVYIMHDRAIHDASAPLIMKWLNIYDK